ncbi:unnamed protein product [Blepharisma stoltei]|uniref:Uncharacterized protein n=1 Tax=Blepharisma stoltei TaxID=1481888 RepID=A0AAU9K2J8_9CILI|nr:unnamed protein product [Blepharisma stoltei]
MYRALPVGNKVVDKRFKLKTQEIHEWKLKHATSSLSSTPPPSYRHVSKNTKKSQLLEEKFTEIERENRILYEKMYKIHSTNKNPKSNSAKKSLNSDLRKRRMQEIIAENASLLKRIQKKESTYRIDKYEVDRKETEKILNNICEFPYILGVEGKPIRNLSARLNSTGSFSRRTARKLDPIYQEDHRAQVYKQGLIIQEKYFIVEIRTDKKTLLIMAYNIEDPEKYSLEISYKEARKLMKMREDYDKLAALVKFENNELVLAERYEVQDTNNAQDINNQETDEIEQEIENAEI